MGKWLWEVELGCRKCFVGFWEVDCGVVDVRSELLLWIMGKWVCEMWVLGIACGLLKVSCGSGWAKQVWPCYTLVLSPPLPTYSGVLPALGLGCPSQRITCGFVS